ncbi:AI-2E family transporter [Methylobacterium nodulans]|uniref:Putative permease n=1 Tax=Methylobacterium nodulans (strain LMG 21967 / CNCM I-2342 / ORS 2060) TaxID=460265 RepID=B8IFZ8_METNO|nr:AI-2E family transporter [Methylobacterium nodulans]ACL59708.1 putative permease [Methylobacterium nodulans ORS 2060]
MLDPVKPYQPASVTAAPTRLSRLEVATQLLTGLALLGTLWFHLLTSLLAGLLVYELVHLLAPRRSITLVHHHTAKVIVVTLLAAIVVTAVGAGTLSLIALLSGGSDNLSLLLRKMAEVIDTARSSLPSWALSFLPEESTELKTASVTWLREHAGQLRSIGQDVWHALFHIVFGLVIGGMVAVSRETGTGERGPLVHALTNRLRLLAAAFRNVVFAQVRISALNTALTALYLLVAVPWLGIPLPFTKTMVVVTFVTGLLPVIGNLISNTVIVLVSLSVSPALAVASLAFLVVIHKLEYFLNARVMGGQIHARAWEILVAMLIMEALFGIPGLVAAPIFYAYLKNELSLQRLI